MSSPLMLHKSAQEAYRLSRPRSRRGDAPCFCGQSGTALLLAMMAGYTTLLCSGLQLVGSSLGQQEREGDDAIEHHSGGQTQNGGNEDMLPVIIVMAASTAFGFLGPLQDNPFHQSGREFTALALLSFLFYSFLFWTYEVESLLGIFCSATIVSLLLHPVYALLGFCFPQPWPPCCNPCVWFYQLLFIKHHHLKSDDDDLSTHNDSMTNYFAGQNSSPAPNDALEGKLNV